MKILRNTLLLLAASSIAFTSCNKKENEILDELHATTYAADANATFKISGKNTSVVDGQKNFEYSFEYKFLDKADDENMMTTYHYKGENPDGTVYEYYQHDFQTTVYGNDYDNDKDYLLNASAISFSFTTYTGTLPNTWKENNKTNTPYYGEISYNIERRLENNDYWRDSRDFDDEDVTISDFTYDTESGALNLKFSAKYDGYDSVEDRETTINVSSGVLSSKIYKQIVKPVVVNNNKW